MMLRNKLLGIALTAIAAGALVSCSNELNENSLNDKGQTLKLVKSPDITAWTGTTTLTPGTKATRGEAEETSTPRISKDDSNVYFEVTTVTDDWNDIYQINGAVGPKNIVDFLKWGINGYVPFENGEIPSWIKNDWISATYEAGVQVNVSACFPEGTVGDEALKKLKTDFAVKATQGYSVTFYPYLTGATDQKHKEIGLFYYDSEGNRYDKKIWDAEINGYNEGKIEGVKVTINKDCVFGLYFSGRSHDSSTVNDMIYYSVDELNQPSEKSSYPNITVHAGMIPQENLNGFYDGHVMMVEDWDDFDFDDFMIFIKGNVKIVDEKELTDPTPGETPDEPGDDKKICDKTEQCHSEGHEAHGDNPCPKCGENEGCNAKEEPVVGCPNAGEEGYDEEGCGHNHKDPSQCPECGENEGCNAKEDKTPDILIPDPLDPGFGYTPTPAPTGSEVEVNLSVKSEGYDDFAGLVSKLSIHVRHAGDVEVFIPVPAEKYCEADDMYIFEQHWVEDFAYGGHMTENKITYNIGENTVTLTVSFEEAGIRVTTDGINEEVFAHCVKNHQDGLNFEVLNYFNELVGLEELQGYLNGSTIKFLDSEPDYYINGFYKNEDNSGANELDCKVAIHSSNSSNYQKASEPAWHLNMSTWNRIYKRNDVENSNPGFLHDHDFLYGKAASEEVVE